MHAIHLVLMLAIVLFGPPDWAQTGADPLGVHGAEATKVGSAIGGDLGQLLKNQDELKSYFKCFLSSGVNDVTATKQVSRIKDFMTNYDGLLSVGAEAMGVPYALSTCLFFVESKFDPDAVSPTGVKGAAQMEEQTFTYIYNSIKTNRESQANFKKLQQTDFLTTDSKDNPMSRVVQFSQGEGPFFSDRKKTVSAEQLQKEVDNASAQMKNYYVDWDLVDSMDGYLARMYSDLKESKNTTLLKRYFKATVEQEARTGKSGSLAAEDLIPPKDFKEFLKSPKWVSAFQLYLLKKMMGTADMAAVDPSGHMNRDELKGGDMVGYLTVLAGAYNCGPNRLPSAMSKGPRVGDWCEDLNKCKSNGETTAHMLAVRQCMTKNYSPHSNSPGASCSPGNYPGADKDPCYIPLTSPIGAKATIGLPQTLKLQSDSDGDGGARK